MLIEIQQKFSQQKLVHEDSTHNIKFYKGKETETLVGSIHNHLVLLIRCGTSSEFLSLYIYDRRTTIGLVWWDCLEDEIGNRAKVLVHSWHTMNTH